MTNNTVTGFVIVGGIRSAGGGTIEPRSAQNVTSNTSPNCPRQDNATFTGPGAVCLNT